MAGELERAPQPAAHEERLPVARAFSRVFILPFVAMAIFAGLLIYQIYELSADSRWVEHTDRVMLTGYRTFNALLTMETGLRADLLTGKQEFATRFEGEAATLRTALDQLTILVADNPDQTARAAVVRQEANGWINWANAILEQRRRNDPEYLEAVQSGPEKDRIDHIRAQFQEIFAEELRLRSERTAIVRRATTTAIGTGLAVYVVGSLLFVYFARRETANLTQAYEAVLATVRKQQRNLAVARDDAQAASRAKDQFLATVSHELRNPLNPIMMWSVLLRDQRLDEAKRLRASEAIEQNVRSLAQLIDDLLDVARIEAGKMRLDVGPVELQRVVEAALQTVQPGADAKQVRVRVILDPRAGPIAGDPARLQQIIWNLLSNAVKFTPKGGSITVTLTRVNSQVELTVADTGQGISSEMLAHVFDPFWQGESGSTRPRGGLGLGLAIVRHLVELHAGTVAVHSDGPGQGTVFKITFPLFITARDYAPERRSDGSPVLPSTDLVGLRVLVVDDDRGSADAVATLLASSGADVCVAVSAQEAVEQLKHWTADVLLSDIEMPGEDGYALIRRLRGAADTRQREIPAAALTAYARVEDRIKALEAGFQMHITKPVDPAELLAVVASLASRA